MAEVPETPCTPFTHPIPKGWGYWVDPPKNRPALKDHLLAKFHQDLSSGLDFCREHTHTLLPLPPWEAQIKKQKYTRLLKFDFREILFYKYCTILKKIFYPPPGPPLDTRNS